MSKELVIGSNRHETKVAILEEDQLVEIYFQRANEYSLAGSIHKGKVTRVLPGMQSAFVDLGLERDTFLYVSDFFEENPDIDTVDEKPARDNRRDENRRDNDRRDRGQSRLAERPVIVQAAPEPPIDEEPEVPQSSVVPDDSVSAAVAPAASAAAPNDNRQSQRAQDGDRNFRGDRRGRRSRRRRTRGGGFPENKYAQPGAASVASPEPNSVQEDLTEEPEVFDTEEQDVIILPGESLAKYRTLNLPSAAGPARAQEAEAQTEAQQPAPEHQTQAETAAIAAEAESIDLADKIFAHHPDPDAVEEQRPEPIREEAITHTERPSPFIVSGAEALDIEQSEVEPAREHAHADVSGSLPALDPSFEEDEPGMDEDEASEDVLDAVSPEPGTEPSNAEPNSEPVSQTATVRDPGDRYPHRVSRRMRRRRSGNRFQGPNNNPQNGNPEASEARTAGAGEGTVAALEAEPRIATPIRPIDRSEERPERAQEKPDDREDRAMPSISELLKPGQEIIVQIAKEPLGQKGARITSHIALPGRYVVFMPSVTHLGVSRKIASDEERQRLKRILQAHRVGTAGGFIVRTAGEGVPEDEIAADMDFLYKSWLDIRQKAEKKPAPMLLHCDLDIVQRILRDQVTEEFKAIWVDSEDMYENILSFLQRFQPALVSRVKMYTRQAPIFDSFGITQELEKALRPKVWLKSGGYIVINQTEALVAIDINTGKYVGKSNRLEDTIVKTNTEAVKEIVRQIRLRDLGGIIVVDFIDMDERKNRQKVMQALEEAMRGDRSPSKILQFNDFGLVAITRKRVKQSLERTLCSPCPYCEGAGYVKSVQTVIGEILIEAQKIARAIEGKDVLLRVHPEVAKVLKGNDNKFLEEIEEILGRPVLVKGDPALHIEKFDLG